MHQPRSSDHGHAAETEQWRAVFFFTLQGREKKRFVHHVTMYPKLWTGGPAPRKCCDRESTRKTKTRRSTVAGPPPRPPGGTVLPARGGQRPEPRGTPASVEKLPCSVRARGLRCAVATGRDGTGLQCAAGADTTGPDACLPVYYYYTSAHAPAGACTVQQRGRERPTRTQRSGGGGRERRDGSSGHLSRWPWPPAAVPCGCYSNCPVLLRRPVPSG